MKWASREEYNWEPDANFQRWAETIWNWDVFGYLPTLLSFQESNLLKENVGFLMYNATGYLCATSKLSTETPYLFIFFFVGGRVLYKD